ncbi:unnamed protein product [Lathyrus sativus]|nr:unnamed protein product [Lathyrus sativus]
MKVLTLTLTFCIIVAFSNATPTLVTRLQHQINQYSTIDHTQQKMNETTQMEMCSYSISVKTSCNSPAYSKDTVGVLFGDADGKEVKVLELDSENEVFEQCKTLIFRILGQCIGKICRLYVARAGSDGWVPETIIAYNHNYPPVVFNYNYFIPEGVARGFDDCGN